MPSTESLSKILSATGSNMAEFVSLLAEPGEAAPRIPILGYAQAGAEGYFDDAGYPAGTGWDEVLFPEVGDPHAYALEISGDSMEPVYRDGDRIIVSPAASIRRGDRIVVRTAGGEVMAKELTRQSANRLELRSFNPAHPMRTLKRPEVAWMARIIWLVAIALLGNIAMAIYMLIQLARLEADASAADLLLRRSDREPA